MISQGYPITFQMALVTSTFSVRSESSPECWLHHWSKVRWMLFFLRTFGKIRTTECSESQLTWIGTHCHATCSNMSKMSTWQWSYTKDTPCWPGSQRTGKIHCSTERHDSCVCIDDWIPSSWGLSHPLFTEQMRHLLAVQYGSNCRGDFGLWIQRHCTMNGV